MDTTVNNETSKMLPEGSILNGKYKILKQLSSRALGNMYLANDTKFRENVLIKELFVKNISKRSSDEKNVEVDNNCLEIYQDYIDRFNEEARALRQFNNKHIAKVTDLFSENNTAYYVMENIEGELLSKKMTRKNKTLGESEAISYLTQMLDGLNAMHSQGFWHLDITPSNIIVDDNGNVKFLEFGHCKLVDNESTIIADINHDPMELQALDENNIGPWTDYYSLGATLYNLLTGKRPPAAAEINEATTNLYHFPTSVSKKMQRLILWMMTPNIFRRPQDSNEINDFLYGITGTSSNDKTFQKNLNNASHSQTKKTNKKKYVSESTNDDTDSDDEEDGLSNKTLKAMQIFIFLAILGILGYFAYKALFGTDSKKNQSAKNSVTIKKEEAKNESKVDTRTGIDVLSINNENEEEEKKKEEAKKEEEARKLEELKKEEDKLLKEKDPQSSTGPNSEKTEDKKPEVSKAESNQDNNSKPANSQQSETANQQTTDNSKPDSQTQNQEKQSQEQSKPTNQSNSANNEASSNETTKKKYNVIVGSFSSQENANSRIEELKARGFNATVKHSESNNMYRVIVVNADENTKEQLKARYSDAWVE